MKTLGIALALSLAAAAPALAQPAAPATTVIHAGQLLDKPGQRPRGASTIVIQNGKIGSVQDGFAEAPAGARVVDLRDRFVMPGLIDMHVHLYSEGDPLKARLEGSGRDYEDGVLIAARNARTTLNAGFTTVRDLGGDTSSVIAVRDAVAEGRFPGPRIKVSGDPLSIIGGHADAATGLPPELAEAINEAHLNPAVCTGPNECQKVVRQLAAAGVDVIKVMATGGVLDPGAMGLEQHFSDAELKAIADAAHAMHLKVAAHAHGARGIEAAARAGIDSIEHGTFLDAAGAQAMKANGTYYSATLIAFSGAQALIGTGKISPESEAKARMTVSAWGKGLNLAYRTGIKIALGTDSAVAPHNQAGKELELMVTKGGMTPRDALIAATKGGPDLMDLSAETGTLDPGKSADLIAVEGDPLVDPTAVQRVDYVMVRGRPIPMKGAE